MALTRRYRASGSWICVLVMTLILHRHRFNVNSAGDGGEMGQSPGGEAGCMVVGGSFRQTRHATQRPVSVYPGLKALAGFRLKPVLRTCRG
jgi:hypothetical protein